MKARELSSSI